ncbi:hypothetical protein R3P38DRAFT_2882741 [Favolaschia claudopus]|uniref:F-box domain-containing protein n=1 Tax=Favolaschia claudopus TaxID=2862362 RepID=A0AAW0CZA0_9AGAR
MSSLPGELVDSIIDFTYALTGASSSSLATYALVSKQWLPRSRYYYFSSIRLTRTRSLDTIKTFLTLLASPHVTFLSSVKETEIYHRSSYGTPVLTAGDILVLIQKHGIRVRRLSLDCHFLQLGLDGSPRADFNSISELRVHLYGDVSLGKFFRVISLAFPSLESLVVQALHTGGERGSVEFPAPGKNLLTLDLPANLKRLEIGPAVVLQTLREHKLAPWLQELIDRSNL